MLSKDAVDTIQFGTRFHCGRQRMESDARGAAGDLVGARQLLPSDASPVWLCDCVPVPPRLLL